MCIDVMFDVLPRDISQMITMCSTNLLGGIALNMFLETDCVRQMGLDMLCWTYCIRYCATHCICVDDVLCLTCCGRRLELDRAGRLVLEGYRSASQRLQEVRERSSRLCEVCGGTNLLVLLEKVKFTGRGYRREW